MTYFVRYPAGYGILNFPYLLNRDRPDIQQHINTVSGRISGIRRSTKTGNPVAIYHIHLYFSNQFYGMQVLNWIIIRIRHDKKKQIKNNTSFFLLIVNVIVLYLHCNVIVILNGLNMKVITSYLMWFYSIDNLSEFI